VKPVEPSESVPEPERGRTRGRYPLAVYPLVRAEAYQQVRNGQPSGSALRGGKGSDLYCSRMVAETAEWISYHVSLSAAPRLGEELKREHGDIATGMKHEMEAEAAVLMDALPCVNKPGYWHIPSAQIIHWPSVAANNISRRLYVNRTMTIQFLVTTEETRAENSADLLRQWERREDNRTRRRLILSEPLPPREREVILLFLSGHTDRQAAERLGVAPGTIKTLLHRARKRLAASSALRAFVFD